MSISELAVVGKGAKIHPDANIGPFAVIEDGVELGPRVSVGAHAYICRGTTVGEDTKIHMGAVLGNEPQDLAFENGSTYLNIGKRNVIREYATLHRGTKEGSATVVGDDCYLMAVAHVGHNCHLGNKVIIANGALLAGHVVVEDAAFISGNVVIHQFCRIGTLAMIGGYTGVNKDVPPYMLVRGPSVIRSLNLVGLRRAKFDRDTLLALKEAFKILYLSGLNTSNALEEIKKMVSRPEIDHLAGFIRDAKRGTCAYRSGTDDFFD